MFLKNLSTLLEAGYSMEDALTICNSILDYSLISDISEKLKNGYALDKVLLESKLPKLFQEYFSFFKNKSCLSEAIKKSLSVCLSKQEYQNQLKSKLTYPLILLAFLFLFSLFVIFILLPNVNNLFDSFGIEKSLLIQIIYMFFYILPALLIIVGCGIIYATSRLLLALKHKSHRIIEKYLKIPGFKIVLQKYFSLKFAVYYNELLNEELDSASIIKTLNHQMNDSDIKIVLYEMNNRMEEGEALENILIDFDYLDSLFLTFFMMYMKNPTQNQSISQYIDLTYEQIDIWIAHFLKWLIPLIYGFVAIFVITIYISIIIPMMNVISDI